MLLKELLINTMPKICNEQLGVRYHLVTVYVKYHIANKYNSWKTITTLLDMENMFGNILYADLFFKLFQFKILQN